MRWSWKILIFGFLVLYGLSAVPSAYSQRSAQEYTVETLAGEIISIDFKASLFILRTRDKKELTLIVPAAAKIFKGSERISFAHLEKNDEILIKYFNDDSGVIKVTSITVENPIEEGKPNDRNARGAQHPVVF